MNIFARHGLYIDVILKHPKHSPAALWSWQWPQPGQTSPHWCNCSAWLAHTPLLCPDSPYCRIYRWDAPASRSTAGDKTVLKRDQRQNYRCKKKPNFSEPTHIDIWTRSNHRARSIPLPGFYSRLPWRACSTWTAAADPSEPGRTAPCTPRPTSGCPGPSPSPPRCCCSAPAPRWSGCGRPWSAPSARTGCTAARCCSGCTSTWTREWGSKTRKTNGGVEGKREQMGFSMWVLTEGDRKLWHRLIRWLVRSYLDLFSS